MSNFPVKYNYFNQLESPQIVLCNPDGRRIASLANVHNIKNTIRYNAVSELEFTYPQSPDGGITINSAYAHLLGRKLIYLNPSPTPEVSTEGIPTNDFSSDIYTKILLHMEGTDGSTNFIDEAGNTWLAEDGYSPRIATWTNAIGEGCGYFTSHPSDNNYMDYIYTLENSDFDLQDNDWTFDFWVKADWTVESEWYIVPFAHNPSESGASVLITIGNYSGNSLRLIFKSIDNNNETSSYFYCILSNMNEWNHFAIQRSNDTPYMFVNGVSQSITIEKGFSGVTIPHISENVILGGYCGLRSFYMDEFRLSNGIARWSTDFIAPTRPYAKNGDYYIIKDVTENTTGAYPTKTILAFSAEFEMTERRITGFTGTYTLIELMKKVLKHIPTWSLESVDNSLLSLYRTFDVNNSTIYSFLTEEVEKAYGCVFEFDTFNKFISAKTNVIPDPSTNVFISFDNIMSELEVREITEEICTALSCYGGEDLDIHNVNPLGGNIIYDFSYFKTSEWMTAELISALNAWEADVEYYLETADPTYSELLLLVENTWSDEDGIIYLESQLADLNSSYESLEEVYYARLEQGLDTTSIKAQMESIKLSISSTKAEINNKYEVADTTMEQMRKIVHSLYFTSKLSFDTFSDDLNTMLQSITTISSQEEFAFRYEGALLHMDGIPGASVFTDLVGSQWVYTGAPPSLNANGKFNQCGDFSTAYSSIATKANDIFTLDGDWTIDFWVYLTDKTTDTNYYIIRQYLDDDNEWEISLNVVSGTLDILAHCDYGGVELWKFHCHPGVSFPINEWNHIAVVRQDNTPYIFVNGVSQSLTIDTAFSGVCGYLDTSLYVGYLETATGGFYLDELRYYPGRAMWIAGFTPPTDPYVLETDMPGNFGSGELINTYLSTSYSGIQTLKNYIDEGFSSYPLSSSEILTVQNYINSAKTSVNSLYYEVNAAEDISTPIINSIRVILYELDSYLTIVEYDSYNLTYTQYLELTQYIYENSYINGNIVQTSIMTPAEIQAQSQLLYDQSVSILTKVSQPRYEFSGKFSNFFAVKNFIDFANELQMGKPIRIQKGDNTVINAVLLEIVMNYDNPTDFSMTFGNSYRLDNQHFIYGDLLGGAAKSGSGLSS